MVSFARRSPRQNPAAPTAGFCTAFPIQHTIPPLDADDRTDDGACGADDITHIYNRQMSKNLRFQMTDNTQ